jgi:hypothetical protein
MHPNDSLSPEEQREWDAWIMKRCAHIQAMASAYPPNRLYRRTDTGHIVTLVSYEDDGTVTVCVSTQYNTILWDRHVCGVPPSLLEPCDPPVLAQDPQPHRPIPVLRGEEAMEAIWGQADSATHQRRLAELRAEIQSMKPQDGDPR